MTTGLPQVLEEIADVAGIDAAWAFVREHGGTNVYIPAQLGETHWLITLVGRPAAEAICRHFRDSTAEMGHVGRRLLIPKASSAQGDAAWEKVLSGELSLRQVAQVMDVTERAVSYRRARRARQVPRPDKRQRNLF